MPHHMKSQQAGSLQEEVLNHDYTLLCLVIGLLGMFYFGIMWILSSANSDREARLDKLKHS